MHKSAFSSLFAWVFDKKTNFGLIFLHFGGIFGLKKDFVDHKKYHHRHTAVQYGCYDIIEPTSDVDACYGNPNAVDGIDHAGDQAKR